MAQVSSSSSDVTFTQLGGKYLRCNQTGEIITRNKVKKRRIGIARELSGWQRQPKRKAARKVINEFRAVRMSRISVFINWTTDSLTCPHCGKRLFIPYTNHDLNCYHCDGPIRACI